MKILLSAVILPVVFSELRPKIHATALLRKLHYEVSQHQLYYTPCCHRPRRTLNGRRLIPTDANQPPIQPAGNLAAQQEDIYIYKESFKPGSADIEEKRESGYE